MLGAMTPDPPRRALRLLAGTAVLALLAATCWWAWMAWDSGYHLDPDTGAPAGPYRAWQVVGCALSLIALAVAAARRLPAAIVLTVLPAAFTAAWSATALARDGTGLWAVGALLVAAGTAGGTAVVVLAVAALRRAAGP